MPAMLGSLEVASGIPEKGAPACCTHGRGAPPQRDPTGRVCINQNSLSTIFLSQVAPSHEESMAQDEVCNDNAMGYFVKTSSMTVCMMSTKRTTE